MRVILPILAIMAGPVWQRIIALIVPVPLALEDKTVPKVSAVRQNRGMQVLVLKSIFCYFLIMVLSVPVRFRK